jgi:hypothetical protein
VTKSKSRTGAVHVLQRLQGHQRALTLLSAVAYSASPPKELYAKSIIVTWTEHRNQRQVGEADFRDVVVPLSLTIYVSTIGRPFSRTT